MEQILSDHDRAQLDRRIAEAEKRTGAQMVVAVIKRSDTYAELPWEAFALGAKVGASIGGFTFRSGGSGGSSFSGSSGFSGGGGASGRW